MKSAEFRIGAFIFLAIFVGALADDEVTIDKDAPAEEILQRILKGESSSQRGNNDPQQQASSESTEYAAAVSMAHEGKAPVTLTDEQFHNLVHIRLPGSNKMKKPKTSLTIEKLKKKGYLIDSYDPQTGIVTLKAYNNSVSNYTSHFQPQIYQNAPTRTNAKQPLQPLTAPKPVEPFGPQKLITPILPPQPISPHKPINPTEPITPVLPPQPIQPVIITEPILQPKLISPTLPPQPIQPIAPPVPTDLSKPITPVLPPQPIPSVAPQEPINPSEPITPILPPHPIQPVIITEPIIPPKPISPVLPPPPIQPITPPEPIIPVKPLEPILPLKPFDPILPPTPVGPVINPKPVEPLITIAATPSPEVTQRIISPTPDDQPPLFHDPVGLRVLVTTTISPTPPANYKTTTSTLFTTNAVVKNVNSKKPPPTATTAPTANCPNFQQFINGSVELWNGLKNSEGVKDGFDVLSHSALDTFAAISHCVIKIFSDIGGWFGDVPTDIANSFHNAWKTQNPSAPGSEQDKSDLPTPVRYWKKVPVNTMESTSFTEKQSPVHVHQGELRIAQGKKAMVKTDSVLKRKDFSPSIPPEDNESMNEKELNKRNAPVKIEPHTDKQKGIMESFKGLFNG